MDVVAVRTMAQALQAADRQIGGGRLYPSVLRYLHAEIAPALVDPRGDDRSGELFAAAASLTEMAGWMAHDGGQDGWRMTVGRTAPRTAISLVLTG